MKFKKFRLNKNCIYEDDTESLEFKARMACLFGYPFIKDGVNYYQVSVKEYKNKPGTLEVNMVEVEIVGGISINSVVQAQEGNSDSLKERKEKNKPACFTPNKDAYPLCIGFKIYEDDVFTTCKGCQLYENYPGPYDND